MDLLERLHLISTISEVRYLFVVLEQDGITMLTSEQKCPCSGCG